MANERLYQFPNKAAPVPADLIYGADSANSNNEINITIAQLISAYPNLSAYAALTLGANTYSYTNNSSVVTAGTITALGVSLLADTTIAAMQTTLGNTATPTASQFAGWDANKNLSANSFISGYTTTATAAGTTTLVVGSTYQQFFTGSTTQTVLLPVTSTLVLGQPFYIVNNSSGNVTVQSSGGNNIQVMAANTTLLVTCILTSGTTAASWYADYNFQSALALPVSLANGGTNASLTASNGGIVWSNATQLQILAGTATANLPLLSGSTATPSWGSFALSLGGAFTSAGAVTYSGAHGVTWTVTGTTGLTLPTSGTLATTSGSLASIAGDSGTATVSSGSLTLTGGSTGLVFTGSGATLTMSGTVAIANGGTAKTSVTTVAAATSWAGWDANVNMSSNNFLPAYTTTATAAATTTLTVGSTYAQFFTGSTTQICKLPVTSTLYAGFPFYIVNNSSGNVTINSSGGNSIQVMAAGTTAYLTCVNTGVTTAAGWNCEYAFNGGSGSGTVNSGLQYSLAYYATIGTAVSGLTNGTTGQVLTATTASAPSWQAPAAPTLNYQLSSSSGNYSTTSGTPAAVTNLSVTITTAGQPVMLQLVPDNSANQGYLGMDGGGSLVLTWYRGITALGTMNVSYQHYEAPGGCVCLDAVGAGTYTYTIQASVNSSTGRVAYCKLFAYEM